MASACYSEDLTCAICLTFFTDPVNLPCGHSFCRECISHLLRSQCPLCQRSVPTDAKYLPTSHTLNRLAEKAKEEKIKTEHGQEKQMAELCPEHEEKLKLFCVTDQQLACIICRDGEKHAGHKFKPIKEAAASLRRELEKGVENLSDDILTTGSRANTQREEIRKTKEKSQQLMTQICRQFEEMHQFLRKREDEIKNELKLKEEDAVEEMTKALNVIETVLSESRELQGKVTSVLNIEGSERFLMSWTEGNSTVTSEHLLRPRVDDLRVENCALCLGPYESHLQFFMWKEMLQVIQPRAELLSLRSNSRQITVSDDGRSLFGTPESSQAQSASRDQTKTGLFLCTPPACDQSKSSSLFGSTPACDQSKSSSLFGSTPGFAQNPEHQIPTL
ncbi:nuclear factor 7, ovary-like [Pempheris klunzingeri]|uniref:nuclear factor 7, ovary-like n=1 Tax=Pempheris klunzingeri TaxID=3127111 RepID=UPI00397FB89E